MTISKATVLVTVSFTVLIALSSLCTGKTTSFTAEILLTACKLSAFIKLVLVCIATFVRKISGLYIWS